MRPIIEGSWRRREFRAPNALEWLCVCTPALVFVFVLALAALLAFPCGGGFLR